MVLLGGVVVMLVSLHFGEVCSAPPMPLGPLEMEVEFGGTVVLPCNGSAYLPKEEQGEGDEGEFRWEAMGADVAFLEGGELNEGHGYQGRVHLAPEAQRRQGDWSLVLNSVVLSDSDMYECIWNNRRTISTVWVKVKEPSPERSVSVLLGDAVRLPCYGDVPKTLRSEELYVQWLRDGQQVALLSQDHVEINDQDPGRLTLWPSEPLGELALIISPVLLLDHGEYHCLYRTRSFEEARPGVPQSITVTVLGGEVTTDPVTESVTWTQTDVRTDAGSTDQPSPVYLEDSSLPQVSITSQPMEALEETETSLPDQEKGVFELVQWETMPWIRVGLIAGVLVLTAVVLCILGTLCKI